MSYNLPWKTRIPLFIFSTAVAASCRKNFTVNRRIWSLFDFKIPPSQIPRDGVKTSDIMIDAARNLWFRLYIPTSAAAATTSSPIMIYMHGGGFSLFTADSVACENSCKRLASQLEAIVVSINYRLAPEHKYPCQYEDCFDALKFIGESFGEFPSFADTTRCFLIGDSAGGNLVHHMAVKASGYEFQRLKIAGLILIQPFFGGEERTESEIRLAEAPILNVKLADWFWKAFLPEGSNRDHPAANVFGSNSEDISGLEFPPILLFIGGFDPSQDWQRKYYENMIKVGKQVHLVEYPNAIHGFWGQPELPEYSLFSKQVRDFIYTKTIT